MIIAHDSPLLIGALRNCLMDVRIIERSEIAHSIRDAIRDGNSG